MWVRIALYRHLLRLFNAQCSPNPKANLLTSLWLESRDGERHGFGNVAKREQNTFIIAGCGQRRVY